MAAEPDGCDGGPAQLDRIGQRTGDVKHARRFFHCSNFYAHPERGQSDVRYVPKADIRKPEP